MFCSRTVNTTQWGAGSDGGSVTRAVGLELYTGARTQLLVMAKRRAEESLLLLHEFPSKTLPRSLLSVDLQLEADPPAARPMSRSPPALLAVVGGRCRKRPHSSSEEPEQKPEEPGVCSREHAADVVTVQTPVCVQERHGSGSPANHKKRPREDCEASPPGAVHKVSFQQCRRICTFHCAAQRKWWGVVALAAH